MGGPTATSQKYDLYSSQFRATTLETLRAHALAGPGASDLRLAIQPEHLWWRPIPNFPGLASPPVAWD